MPDRGAGRVKARRGLADGEVHEVKVVFSHDSGCNSPVVLSSWQAFAEPGLERGKREGNRGKVLTVGEDKCTESRALHITMSSVDVRAGETANESNAASSVIARCVY